MCAKYDEQINIFIPGKTRCPYNFSERLIKKFGLPFPKSKLTRVNSR